MLKAKRHRPEPVAPPKPPSDMEKNIKSLRAIRQMRLERLEAEYRKLASQLTDYQKKLKDAADAIDNVKKEVAQKKSELKEKHLSATFKQSDLQRWFYEENQLDDLVIEAVYKEKKEREQVAEIEKQVMESKEIYRKAQLGIEKLDILEEELRLTEED